MADIDIGKISEALNNKVDLPSVATSQDDIDFVVEWQKPTSANGYTWYRKYKSGWVEQGGLANQTNSSASVGSTVVLPVEMSDGNYFISFCNYSGATGNGSTAYVQDNAVTNVTATTFTFCRNYNGPKRWQVSGYAA